MTYRLYGVFVNGVMMVRLARGQTMRHALAYIPIYREINPGAVISAGVVAEHEEDE